MKQLNRAELFDQTYLKVAEITSELSRARRLKVGACLVTKSGVTITGFNGTPPGVDNNCEDEVDGNLVTKPSVIHAELNCIMKAAREGVSVVDSTIYITHAPCVQCAASLLSCGVKKVLFRHLYRSDEGVKLLTSQNVSCTQF